MEEEWRAFSGTRYEVSNLGNVRIHLKSGVIRPVRQYYRADGTPYVQMYIHGRQRGMSIAGLVYQLFEL